MADIRRFPFIRHLRGAPNVHVLRYRRGRQVRSGPGLTFWFHPLHTSVAEIPVDDRDLPFLFHGRSVDFQDVTVQGAVTFCVVDPEAVARRIDFTIDLDAGKYREAPLEQIGALLGELAQQLTWDYLAHTELAEILENGVEQIRGRIDRGLRTEGGLTALGLEIVHVRVAAVKAKPEVEKALQTPTREAIQQRADEAQFARRALAVEKERAIQENELQNRIELAHREERLIEQEGQNDRRRASEAADAARIEAQAAAEQGVLASRTEAEGIELIERARVEAELARVAAERERMDIYRDLRPEQLLGLAAQELAGKLETIEHVNITPDMLGDLLTRLIQIRTGTEAEA